MNTRLFIYGSALLAFLPAVLFASILFAPTNISPIIMPLIVGVSISVGLVFALHAFVATSLSTEDKVLWSIGMVLFSPALLAPAYWFQQVRPDLDWHKYRELSRA